MQRPASILFYIVCLVFGAGCTSVDIHPTQGVSTTANDAALWFSRHVENNLASVETKALSISLGQARCEIEARLGQSLFMTRVANERFNFQEHVLCQDKNLGVTPSLIRSSFGYGSIRVHCYFASRKKNAPCLAVAIEPTELFLDSSRKCRVILWAFNTDVQTDRISAIVAQKIVSYFLLEDMHLGKLISETGMYQRLRSAKTVSDVSDILLRLSAQLHDMLRNHQNSDRQTQELLEGIRRFTDLAYGIFWELKTDEEKRRAVFRYEQAMSLYKEIGDRSLLGEQGALGDL